MTSALTEELNARLACLSPSLVTQNLSTKQKSNIQLKKIKILELSQNFDEYFTEFSTLHM